MASGILRAPGAGEPAFGARAAGGVGRRGTHRIVGPGAGRRKTRDLSGSAGRAQSAGADGGATAMRTVPPPTGDAQCRCRRTPVTDQGHPPGRPPAGRAHGVQLPEAPTRRAGGRSGPNRRPRAGSAGAGLHRHPGHGADGQAQLDQGRGTDLQLGVAEAIDPATDTGHHARPVGVRAGHRHRGRQRDQGRRGRTPDRAPGGRPPPGPGGRRPVRTRPARRRSARSLAGPRSCPGRGSRSMAVRIRRRPGPAEPADRCPVPPTRTAPRAGGAGGRAHGHGPADRADPGIDHGHDHAGSEVRRRADEHGGAGRHVEGRT